MFHFFLLFDFYNEFSYHFLKEHDINEEHYLFNFMEVNDFIFLFVIDNISSPILFSIPYFFFL